MSNKTIKINPELFSLGKKKKQTIKNTPVSKNKIKHSVIKNELIKKIKAHRKKEKEMSSIQNDSNNDNNDPNNDNFQDSLNYLNDLHKKRQKKKTLKKRLLNPHVAIELPDSFNDDLKPISQLNIEEQNQIHIDNSLSNNNTYQEEQSGGNIINNKLPAYSCLKNSSKPTYREWKKKTQKNYDDFKTDQSTIVIEGPPIEEINKNVDNYNNIKNIYNLSDKKITKKKTKKYKLGKKNRTVSILIKNSKTRRQVKDNINDLKNKQILEIKNYLKKKGLIKVGCIAPNNVLRTMYENAVLCGDVNNTSGETLVHNFMNS